jgi:serine/threonine-protein kinase HipA
VAKTIETAKVFLWDSQIGAVAWNEQAKAATFAYTDGFIKTGLQPSPIHMPASRGRKETFTFRNLGRDTYSGLPGMLADTLPDKFGNALINLWLAKNGRAEGSMNPVEKLLYMGNRSMGALEFRPAMRKAASKAVDVNIHNLLKLTNNIMHQKAKLDVNAYGDDALTSILQVGTSAGGARPKGIVAIHEKSGHIISGQAAIPDHYQHWIIKFDGVSDMELGRPKGYGRIEDAYHLMAKAAGINMTECKLWEEGGRAHFTTRRFDRDGNKKIHMQSLCGIAHYDFNMAGAYSYEQALLVMQQIGLPKTEMSQLYRRMVFNIVARNQDDHTKNIAFLMTPDGEWKLSPAFDVTYSHNPAGVWTNQHQMLAAGKRDDFSRDDLIKVGNDFSLPHPESVIDEVVSTVDNWLSYAGKAGVAENAAQEIREAHRLHPG